MTTDAEIAALRSAFDRVEDIPLTPEPISIREPRNVFRGVKPDLCELKTRSVLLVSRIIVGKRVDVAEVRSNFRRRDCCLQNLDHVAVHFPRDCQSHIEREVVFCVWRT